MALQDFFPPRPAAAPTIYAFASTHPDHAGLLKVGYTERVAADRIVVRIVVRYALTTDEVVFVEPKLRGRE
jgi:hypothetical protein